MSTFSTGGVDFVACTGVSSPEYVSNNSMGKLRITQFGYGVK